MAWAEVIASLRPDRLIVALQQVLVERRAAPYLSAIIVIFTAVLLFSSLPHRIGLNLSGGYRVTVWLFFIFFLVALIVAFIYHYPRWREQREVRRSLRGWS
jgi:predicted membrane channel-forming protein YqfA (hemolysin III family)